MNSQDTFIKWFNVITSGRILRWGDMDLLTEELLPGFSFKRSSYGPRANKSLYDKSNNCLFRSGINREVGMYALQRAADTDYKKAILKAHETEQEINNLLYKLKGKLKFDLDIALDNGEVNIRIDDLNL